MFGGRHPRKMVQKMRRSEINALMRQAVQFFEKYQLPLPPFAYWMPEEWRDKGRESDEIRDNALGWDITDFGSGDFYRCGLLLFTLRNGNQQLSQYTKPYAEKAMMVREGQVTPYHFHWHKMEDIINRGGGELVLQLYNSAADGSFADTPVAVHTDGCSYSIPAGGVVRLKPGESITLHPKQYHQFWAEGETTLVMEVSQCNDDTADNRFYSQVGRFPSIEEDEPPLYLLGCEYPSVR